MLTHCLITDSVASRAIVIGAGLGGLASAMRLGAKGWRVTVLDRLDRPGGRGSSITKAGHRFDLGPTIVTVPQVFLRSCGPPVGATFRIGCGPACRCIRIYEIRWPDGSKFTAQQDTDAMLAEVARLSPGDRRGLQAVPEGQRGALLVRVREPGPAVDAPVVGPDQGAAHLCHAARRPVGLCRHAALRVQG